MSEERVFPVAFGLELVFTGHHTNRALVLRRAVRDGGTGDFLFSIPLDRLIRVILPDAGFTVTDDWRGPHIGVDLGAGPVCVGGPYDGRRLLKSAVRYDELRVPVFDPGHALRMHDAKPEDPVPFQHGVYRLVRLGKGPYPADLRELWWWVSPKTIQLEQEARELARHAHPQRVFFDPPFANPEE